MRDFKLQQVMFVLAACILMAAVSGAQQSGGKRGRLNRLIEQLEQGRPAISGTDWQFIDMEHGPYLLDRLESTLAGLKNEILEVPGIGAIFIGPADLGMSLGVGPPSPNNAPEAEGAVQSVLKACLARKVTCGYAVTGGDLDKRIVQGFKVLLAAGAPSR